MAVLDNQNHFEILSEFVAILENIQFSNNLQHNSEVSYKSVLSAE